MTTAGELGPIVGLGALEETIRRVLMEPQVLGVYTDEALRQTYGTTARVLRVRDVVCATENRVKLNMPAIVVQVEGDGDTARGRGGEWSVTYVVGVHCITTGGSEADCRRTSDVHAAAARTLLLQRLPGKPIGFYEGGPVVSLVQWDGDAIGAAEAGQKTKAYAEMVVQLSVTVSGVASDRPGVLPDLPPNEPGTTGPAPSPELPPVVEEFTVEIEEPQPE